MPKHSILNDKQAIIAAISKSNSVKEVIENIGLYPSGSAYKRLQESCLKYKIDLPSWDYGTSLKPYIKKLTNEEVFVENSNYHRRGIKDRLLELGFEYKCVSCGNKGEWNGKKLVLQLEHKNGINNDNRIENLEFLCPNCHSQTDSFAGKNSKQVKKQYNCSDCGTSITKAALKCRKCVGKSKMKIQYPDLELLIKMVEEDGYSKVGRALGVSDNSIRKHIIKQRKISEI